MTLKVRILPDLTIFTQLTARLKNFFRSWLLVLSLKEGLVECATVCVKSEVILAGMAACLALFKLCTHATTLFELQQQQKSKQNFFGISSLVFSHRLMQRLHILISNSSDGFPNFCNYESTIFSRNLVCLFILMNCQCK